MRIFGSLFVLFLQRQQQRRQSTNAFPTMAMKASTSFTTETCTTIDDDNDDDDERVSIRVENKKEEADRIAVSNAASLLSYSFASHALEEACITSCLPKERFVNISGNLEQYLANDDDDDDYTISVPNIVSQFLVGLGRAASTSSNTYTNATATTSLRDLGLAIAYNLTRFCPNNVNVADDVSKKNDRAESIMNFRPPKRSLVGTIRVNPTRDNYRNNATSSLWDISLLRDKKDGDYRFSVLISQERRKGKKIARILAEIANDDNNKKQIYLRGIEVNSKFRGQGFASLILSIFIWICVECFGLIPCTCLINKPLIATSLESLGYVADDTRYLVEFTSSTIAGVASRLHHGKVGSNDHASSNNDLPPQLLLRPVSPKLDLGPFYSKSFCKRQNIRLVKQQRQHTVKHADAPSFQFSPAYVGSTGDSWRRCHVNTKFAYPIEKEDELRMRVAERLGLRGRVEGEGHKEDTVLYSARLVAFFSSVKEASKLMNYADSF